MHQSGAPEPIAVTSDGQPIFPASDVPAGSAQPLGVFVSGQPVWPVPSGAVPPGSPVPFGITSDGAPVWANPATRLDSRPTWRKKRVLIPAGIFALFVIAGIAGGEDEATDSLATDASSSATSAPAPEASATLSAADQVAQDKAAADKAATDKAAADSAAADKAAADKAAADKAAADKAAADQAAADEAAAAKAAEAAKGTISQQNAYESAVDYLNFSDFSRKGLIEQLTSEYGEKFPAADAEFAVARLEKEGGVDWNAEASEAAKNYLDISSFSRQGLLDQLTSEYGSQFTPKQAEYGVSQAGL